MPKGCYLASTPTQKSKSSINSKIVLRSSYAFMLEILKKTKSEPILGSLMTRKSSNSLTISESMNCQSIVLSLPDTNRAPTSHISSPNSREEISKSILTPQFLTILLLLKPLSALKDTEKIPIFLPPNQSFSSQEQEQVVENLLPVSINSITNTNLVIMLAMLNLKLFQSETSHFNTR